MKSLEVDIDCITDRVIAALDEVVAGPCVTVYLPRMSDDGRANSALYEAKLALVVSALLGTYRLGEPQVAYLMAPAWRLAADMVYWDKRVRGVAIFAAATCFRCYRLPIAIKEAMTIGDRFDLGPLKELVEELKGEELTRTLPPSTKHAG